MLLGHASAAQNATAAADFLKRAAIIQGDATTGELRLGDQINRAELMKIVVNAAANSVDTFAFRDCLADINSEWFARYVCWAYDNGYVGGYPDGAFHAGNAVNRAEALKIISEVFHLDYQRMAPVADDTLWYDIYVRNAQRQHIIDGTPTNAELSQPVSRGEVFDYLFRAMTVSDPANSDSFDEGQYKTYADAYFAEKDLEKQQRPLTPAEDALLRTLRTQINYGFQPMTGTGSSMMKLGGSGMGMTFDVRTDMSAQGKMDGTKDTLHGYSEDVQMVFDVKTTGDENVSFKATADVSVAGSGTKMLYAKLNNVELLDVQAPIETKLILTDAMKQVDDFENIWFSFDLSGLEAGVPLENSMNMYQALGLASVDYLERSMKASSKPYFEIIQSDEGSQATILIKPNANRISAMVENIVLGMQPSTNRYMVRQSTRTFDSALNMLATNMSMLLTYDKTDMLIRKFAAILDPVTVEIPEERTKLTLELAIEEYYNYDKDFEIKLPTDAVDFDTFVNAPRPDTGTGTTLQ